MDMANNLLRARHLGVKDFREHMAQELKKKQMLVLTQYGQPSKVIMNYEDMLEFIDIIDELQDPSTIKAVAEARQVIRSGSSGVPASNLFSRVRKNIAGRK